VRTLARRPIDLLQIVEQLGGRLVKRCRRVMDSSRVAKCGFNPRHAPRVRRLQRGIRSSGKSAKIGGYAQGWQGLQMDGWSAALLLLAAMRSQGAAE
jgi:hypothetical protein